MYYMYYICIIYEDNICHLHSLSTDTVQFPAGDIRVSCCTSGPSRFLECVSF